MFEGIIWFFFIGDIYLAITNHRFYKKTNIVMYSNNAFISLMWCVIWLAILNITAA